jgi:hypothetical protein
VRERSAAAAPLQDRGKGLTLLIAQLAYEGDEGPELAYRFERFGRKG